MKLKPWAVSVFVTIPRWISLPQMGKVKQELRHMEALGVSRVEEPTDWCAVVVVVMSQFAV